MKQTLLLIAAIFAFSSVFSDTITREQADEIVSERMSRETLPYTVYAKESVQTKMTIPTEAGEEIELDYSCWVYFVSRNTGKAFSGRYLIVNESTGNLLEINPKSITAPGDLTEWRIITAGTIKHIETVLGGCNIDAGLRSESNDSQEDAVIVYTSEDSIRFFVNLNYYCAVKFKTQCKIESDTIKMYITDVCEDFSECYAKCYCNYTFDFRFERKGEINYDYIVEFISPLEERSKILSEGVIDNKSSCKEVSCTMIFMIISLKLKYPDGQPVLLDSSKVFWKSKNRYLEQSLPEWNSSRIYGFYNIVDDGMLKELGNRQEIMRFTGYLNGEIVCERDVLVGADCCHVNYLGTEPLTEVIYGIPDAVRENRFCALLTGNEQFQPIPTYNNEQIRAIIPSYNSFIETVDKSVSYENKLQMAVDWFLSHECITNAHIDCVLCLGCETCSPNTYQGQVKYGRIAISYITNGQTVNVIMLTSENSAYFAGLRPG